MQTSDKRLVTEAALRARIPVNVLDYGATGDGTTDDTAACQAAINAAPEHATVVFPGTHKITTLTLNKRYLTLTGPGTIRDGKIVVGTTGARQDLYWAVRELAFERTTRDAGSYAVELLKGRRGTIEGCTFLGYDKAIYVRPLADAGVHDTAMVKIKGNEFDRVNYAFYVDRDAAATWMHTSDCKFIGNTINLAMITAVHAVSIDGLVLTDNVFFFPNYSTSDTAAKAAKKHNVYLGESDWVHIRGNNFFEAGEEAVRLVDPKHFTVADNLIAWPGQKGPYDAIKLSGATRAIGTIADNTISRFTNHAIGYYLTNASSYVSVTDNVVEYDPATPSYYGTPALTTFTHHSVYQDPASVGTVLEQGTNSPFSITGNVRGSVVTTRALLGTAQMGAAKAQVSVTAANTAVFSLASTRRGTTNFSGLLFLEVRTTDDEAGNLASYVLHVAKHALGVDTALVSAHGLLTGGSANWPSFTFSLDTAGKLLATPVGSTTGTFYFTATFQGNLLALTA